VEALSDLPKGKPFGAALRPAGKGAGTAFRKGPLGRGLRSVIFQAGTTIHPEFPNSKRYFEDSRKLKNVRHLSE